ncbi:XdhC family protein [Herbaspirillum lusitanum]|uniref:XdhC family protein n=1 Tax=Herbaspirillum lusitanum TaxID=213312 RepID=UPI0002F57795|nr:XdhC family protein [Herbaspirillum lusitanum]
MDSIDLEVLKMAIAWSEGGAYTLLVTVVRTWGSAPRPVGSMMVIRGDGHVRGSISGGCIEDDLIHQIRSGEFQATHHVERSACTLTYGISADEAHRFGLPCGGTLQVVVEQVTEASQLHALLQAVEQQGLMTRQLDLRTGALTLQRGMPDAQLHFDGECLTTAHGPRYRLIIVGAAQMSRYVATMALMLDYEVIVCDPREEYLDEWDIARVQLSREMPDDLLLRLQLDAHSAVLTLTHDPKLDDMALLEALKSPAFYVGAIGSRSNNKKRRERLSLFDVSDAEIARLHGPVGMYIGARTPPEIAISILAEMTCIRNGTAVLQTHAIRPNSLLAADDAACSLP